MNKLFVVTGVVLPVINWLLWPVAFGTVAQAQTLQDLALIQRVYPGEYYPDPVVVQSGVPVRFNITTIQQEHQNRISVEPFFITSEPVVPGKVRAALFTPEPPGEYVILNLGHGFTGTLFVMATAEEVARKRIENGFQEFSLLYGTESIYPQEIIVQMNVPLKLNNIGLQENHIVSFEPFLEMVETITPDDIHVLEFIPNRLGTFTIHDETYDNTSQLVVVAGQPDLDFDGNVDRRDVALLVSRLGMQQDATFLTGDFDGDGRVGLTDLAILQRSLGSVADPPAASLGTVPEPTTLTLAALGFIGCAVRWRRGRHR